MILKMSRIGLVAMVSLGLSNCGGGDSAVSTTTVAGATTVAGVTYSGKTTAAQITSTNATALAGSAGKASSSGVGISALRASGATPAKIKATQASQSIVASVKETLLKRGHVLAIGVIQTSTLTSNGSQDFPPNGSGQVTATSKIDDVTGLGSLTMTFASYYDGVTTLNGTLAVNVTAADATLAPTAMSITMTDVSIVNASGISHMGGTIGMSTTSNTDALTMDIVLSADSQSAKLENFVYTSTHDGSISKLLLSESISGRFYDSTEGYFDIVTSNPFLYSPAGSMNPSTGGPMIYTGGGSSKLRITPVDSINATIDVDADGDGIYESTQTVAWTSI